MSLTDIEQRALALTGQLAALFGEIVGNGATREDDLAELVIPLHVIQRSILAQAAARAYPDRYRLLGETLRHE